MKGKRVLLIGLVVFFLLIAGSIWFYDLGAIANNKNYNLATETIDGEHSVTIDLSNPESNKGKIVYDDGDNQIYVSEVIVKERPYQVYFQSSGKFNFRRATLVSAVEHKRVQGGFTFHYRANAYATYQNHSFPIFESGSSALNYRDGDDFGLYLEAEKEIDISQDPIIKITLSNLTLHKWEKR